MDMKRSLIILSVLALMSGCVTNIKPSVSTNPAPVRALKEFKSFELKPLAAAKGVEEPAAMVKIQEILSQKISSLTGTWNRGGGDTLIIEPRVEELKFVGGGQRFFAGALAGSSAVRMTVKLTDKASGNVIATPEFYQRAAAYGGAYSFGATDNNMLDRIVVVMEEYLKRNYSEAVGGPTGLESAEKE
jgi:hypothetical protein